MTITPLSNQDPETRSLDLIQQNLETLKQLFPELITEGPNGPAVNVDTLKALIGDQSITDAEEKYGLNWFGKRKARQFALTPSTGTLRPCPEDSLDWDTTQNIMIEGDNLEVLKLLQKSYAGKVKLIYIDPPYNTGKDFIYPDNFQESIKKFLELTGQANESSKLSSNMETSGRFHTDWLNMCYPRIKLSRDLLRDDGIIIVSIDDNESENLRKVLNEIFGEENYLGTFVINSTPNARDYGHIAKMHEYAYFYCKNNETAETNELEVKEKKFRFNDDISGFNVHPLYNSNEAFSSSNRPNLYFPIYLYPNEQASDCYSFDTKRPIKDCFFNIGFEEKPGAIKIFPPKSEKNGVQFVWRWGKSKCSENFNKEIIGYKTEENEYRIVQKMRHTTKLIRSILDSPEMTSRRGTAEVEELLGGKFVNFPKPLGLLQTFIKIGMNANDIGLDFFAGSGTFAHAIMAENANDGGFRRFILVQLPEPLNPQNNEQKAASIFCDKLNKPRNIAEITKVRLRITSQKIKNDNPLFSGDTGFRVFKLDTSNIQAWEVDRSNLPLALENTVQHLKPGRTEADILYELLLKLGLDLCVHIETRTIIGKTIHSIGKGVLMVCLAEQITREETEPLAMGIVDWYKELSPAGETTCVFRDSGFADDVAKSNLAAILEQYGLSNVRSL